MNEVAARAVLIQAEGGDVMVTGMEAGSLVEVYGLTGMKMGAARCSGDCATVHTGLTRGDTAMVKIGAKSVKVLMK